MPARNIEAAVPRGRERSDRRATTAADRAQDRAFRDDRAAYRGVVEFAQHGEHRGVVAARLHGERALARRRRYDGRIDARPDARGETEPIEAGACEEQRVALALVEAAQARIDVAVQRDDA